MPVCSLLQWPMFRTLQKSCASSATNVGSHARERCCGSSPSTSTSSALPARVSMYICVFVCVCARTYMFVCAHMCVCPRTQISLLFPVSFPCQLWEICSACPLVQCTGKSSEKVRCGGWLELLQFLSLCGYCLEWVVCPWMIHWMVMNCIYMAPFTWSQRVYISLLEIGHVLFSPRTGTMEFSFQMIPLTIFFIIYFYSQKIEDETFRTCNPTVTLSPLKPGLTLEDFLLVCIVGWERTLKERLTYVMFFSVIIIKVIQIHQFSQLSINSMTQYQMFTSYKL